MSQDPGLPVTVRTLLPHRHVPLALSCWPTVLAASEEIFETVFHDDGSLTAADIARLTSLPRARVLRRAEADARMAEQLAHHPHARAFRAGSVWGLKLLDVVLAEAGDCYYVDDDIRFFRRCRGLFRRAALAGRAVFLRDTVWHAYAVRPWHLTGRNALRLVGGLNSGLTLVDRAVYDLDFVDWFLAHPEWRAIPAWTEPTCWAALAARVGAVAVDPRQLINLYPGACPHGAVGAHFLSSFRAQFAPALGQAFDAAAPVEEIAFTPLRQLGPFELAANQLRRKATNEIRRHLAP
jgi:hypothetical protein